MTAFYYFLLLNLFIFWTFGFGPKICVFKIPYLPIKNSPSDIESVLFDNYVTKLCSILFTCLT